MSTTYVRATMKKGFRYCRVKGAMLELLSDPPWLDHVHSLGEIWRLVNKANKYIEESAPWKLSKEDKMEDLKIVIVTLHETLKVVAQAVWPFMPATGEAIWIQLGLHDKPCDVPFKEGMWGFFEKGGKIAKGTPLFPRIETKKA